ncbi:MAG: hypothetical protein K6F53_01010 [Lachnospiraceae bacterium]|nr:hypothetical protein [Lachnospiraceae bacterium]
MLEAVISWIYILIVSFSVGYAALYALLGYLGKHNGDKEGSFLLRPLFCVLAGLCLLTVYAQYFSLFSGVGLAANLLLLITCVIILFVFRRELPSFLKASAVRTGSLNLAVIAFLFLAFALFTSSGYMHYDSDLYHAQSIRWIEEYGIVPGLGNLHSRLAYNSAAFPLTALFSFSFLTGRSLHVMAGLFAFLLSVKILPLFSVFRTVLKKTGSRENAGPGKSPLFPASQFVRLAALYYLCSVFDEITAPSSDYFLVLLIFLLSIFWCELSESSDPPAEDLMILSLLTPVIFSIKLSGALFVLLFLYPAVLFLRGKKYRQVLLPALLMILSAAPFLIRNVILSGYLLYPFPGLDLFSFDFKIPAGMAAYDAAEIGAYGRGLKSALLFDTPFRGWFPLWLSSLGFIDRISFVLSVLCLPVLLFAFFLRFLRKKESGCAIMILCAVTAASFAFWFLNAPLVRYGCVYLYLLPALTAGLLSKPLSERLSSRPAGRRSALMLGSAFLLLFLLYKGGLFVKDLRAMLPRYRAHILSQQDYGDYSDVIDTFVLDGITFYFPAEGDRTGYGYFPSAPLLREDLELRGKDLRAGFRAK